MKKTSCLILTIMIILLLTIASNITYPQLNKTLFPYRDNISGKYGYIDRSGNIIIKPKYFHAGRFKNGIATILINKENDTGFINLQGNIIYCVPVNYNKWGSPSNFSEGLAKASIHKEQFLWGYINTSGKFIIAPKYDDATDFHDGLAIVKYEKNKKQNIVVIDKYGKEYDIIPLYIKENNRSFSYGDSDRLFGNFSDGLLSIRLANGKWGFIDKKGNIILKPQYSGSPFICFPESDTSEPDREFNIPVNHMEMFPFFYKGKAFVKKSNSDDENKDIVCIINQQGQILKEIQAYQITYFSEEISFLGGYEHPTALIDFNGNTIFDLEYHDDRDCANYGNFSDGMCRFLVKSCENRADYFGYIDKTGKKVLTFPAKEYYQVGDFINGLAPVTKSDNSVIYIDKTGKVIFEQ